MMKLARLLKSRSSFGTSIDVGDAVGFNGTSVHSAAISTAAQKFSGKGGQFTDRIFAPYSIFKGKAALSITPIRPTFKRTDSGSLIVGRRGVVMMTFMPAVGERKYDYEKRQNFALSATEVGSLINMGTKDSSEFFHDPSMLSSNAGQVRKSLSIKPYGDSGNGYFISLIVANNVQKTNERFSVPVTVAEFSVLKSACSFALPHIMGWDRLTTPKMPLDMVKSPSKVDSRLPDLEWNK